MGRRSSARARLITTGNNLFRDRGFEAVSVNQLCQEAAVNKGSFYHFFPSKRDLLIEVIENSWDETGLLTSWEESPPQKPIAQLRRYLQELFAYHYADRETSGRVRGSLLTNLSLELGGDDPQIADKLATLFKREINAFKVLLNEASNSNETAISSHSHTHELLVACLHGLVLLAKVRNNLDVLPDNEASLLRLVGISEKHLK
jgi:TetR/AcrR family transcriptional repressor of nem operon